MVAYPLKYSDTENYFPQRLYLRISYYSQNNRFHKHNQPMTFVMETRCVFLEETEFLNVIYNKFMRQRVNQLGPDNSVRRHTHPLLFKSKVRQYFSVNLPDLFPLAIKIAVQPMTTLIGLQFQHGEVVQILPLRRMV
jgi:hypothetical protein